MKKIVFLFAMIFAVGFAMAQTATINQTNHGATGSLQTADVSQTGLSTVTITQISNKVDHPDGLNPEVFSQSSKVKQSGGDNNSVTVYQLADGKINGGSNLNTTTAEQKGSGNVLSQTQISAEYTSGGMDFVSNQSGTDNIGEQYSKKTEADFTLKQNGEGNYGLQTTTGEKTGVLTADIVQGGANHQARQIFHGTNVRWAGASIDQQGVNNQAIQEFDNTTTLWSDPSKADVIQRNENNIAYQSQIGQGSYQYIKQTGVGNVANMWSIGNFNEAYTIQEGESGVINITQKMDNNSARVSQDGLSSVASIYQEGEDNVVEGLGGTGTYAINNNGAQLFVTQIGEMNFVQSKQTVAGVAAINQTGNNNTSVVNQY